MAEAGRTIYIGGIPYDQTEEQVLDIARSVGPVVGARLVFDKETGKSKGFAFVEYKDEETAASAVRNLNNYKIGNRAIRCSFSADGLGLPGGKPKRKLKDEIPPLPAGIDVNDTRPENLAAIVSNALGGLDSVRLQNLVADAKAMASSHPDMMVKLLKQNPQLSYALVQAALLLNKTDSGEVAQLLHNPTAAPATTTAPAEDITPEQRQMVQQVLALTDAQIQQLPEEQRYLVLQLRQKYAV